MENARDALEPQRQRATVGRARGAGGVWVNLTYKFALKRSERTMLEKNKADGFFG
jgi:hypothetical protein